MTVKDGAVSLGTAATNGSGGWTFTPTSDLALGSHTFTATAAIGAGSSSLPSNAVTITVGVSARTAPSITSPTNGTTVSTPRPDVCGTGEPSNPVQVFDGGVLIATTTAAANGSWCATPTSNLAPGTRVLTAQSLASGVPGPLSSPVSITVPAPGVGTFNALGTVTLANLSRDPLNGVTVKLTKSDGTEVATGTSDTDGVFTFPSIPLGSYDLTPTSEDYTFEVDALGNSDPITQSNPSRDYRAIPRVRTPVYTVWNGFLDQINILEVVNTGSQQLNVTVTLFDIEGRQREVKPLAIGAFGQQDIVVNTMTGFAANSYGILKVDFSHTQFDGRLSFYRENETRTAYDFAFFAPFETPKTGETSVMFNTFQPSKNPKEAKWPVFNWLQLTSLHPSQDRTFTISMFDMNGSAVCTVRRVPVPSFGRRDVDAGHGCPGPDSVGLIRITPDDPTSPYIAQLFRYGPNANPGETIKTYTFAYPLVAKKPNGRIQELPISRGGMALNWVEIANATDSPAAVEVNLYNSTGQVKSNQVLVLAPRSQQHIYANSFLEIGESGVVEVKPRSPDSIIASSMFYFYDTGSNSVLTMYGSQAAEGFGLKQFGSYNLYLGQYNWLKLINNRSQASTVTVQVSVPNGSVSTKTYQIPGHGTIDVGIHDNQTFGTQPNSYGTIKITGAEHGDLRAELVRIRFTADGKVDYASTTGLR